MKLGRRQKSVLTTLAVLFLFTVDARKKLLTSSSFSEQAASENASSEHYVLKSAPIVDDKQFQLPSDTGTEKFYWRVDMTPPVLRVGWQTDQSANSKDLTFNFNPASFQSNPRLGPNTAAGVAANTFSLPVGTKYQNAATTSPATCAGPTFYYSCYAGTTANLAAGAAGAAVAATAANSKLPCFPTTTGQCDVTLSPAVGNAPAPATPPATLGSYENAATNTAKKYQYWSVKVKPYLETQLSIQNKIYVDQLLQLDLNFDITSFKSFLFGEGSIWYQYDSSNPTIPNSNGMQTNYRNYFLCGGYGITVKPILMSITVAIKLRNCYKTLIQSLTDWSNWSKIDKDALYFGLLDYCRNSDSETVTVFSYNPIATDYNYIFAGNMENNDPSFDWNGSESSGIYPDANMRRQYLFDYCTVLKSGDAFFDFNEYELYNGGANGDLWCSKTGGWQPKVTSGTAYDYTAKTCT